MSWPVRPPEVAPQVRTTPHVGDVVHYTEPGELRCTAAIVTALGPGEGVVTLDVRWAPDMIRQPEDELVAVRYDPGLYTGPERQARPYGPAELITCADLEYSSCTWHFIGANP